MASLYITSTEAEAGKSLDCLGVMDLLLRNFEVGRVAFFRPLVKDPARDDVELILETFGLRISPEEVSGGEEAPRRDVRGLACDIGKGEYLPGRGKGEGGKGPYPL